MTNCNDYPLLDTEIRFLGDMQRLRMKPGDKFVLVTKQAVSADTAERLREYWDGFAGKEYPLLILCDGLKLGVVGAE